MIDWLASGWYTAFAVNVFLLIILPLCAAATGAKVSRWFYVALGFIAVSFAGKLLYLIDDLLAISAIEWLLLFAVGMLAMLRIVGSFIHIEATVRSMMRWLE